MPLDLDNIDVRQTDGQELCVSGGGWRALIDKPIPELRYISIYLFIESIISSE